MSKGSRAEKGDFPRLVLGLGIGDHLFRDLLPMALESPAFRLIETPAFSRITLVQTAKVRIVPEEGFCWIDETVPCIVLTQSYYETGSDLDLYLDLLHELVHIRQLLEGRDVWDENYSYHQRPTEIEGYAIAVAEGQRLGLKAHEILEHLSNPWMTPEQVSELFNLVLDFLAKK
ncbi:MAG: hypothetical protein WA705_12690 [Candidatus Ozemobacteraceae bacterium]